MTFRLQNRSALCVLVVALLMVSTAVRAQQPVVKRLLQSSDVFRLRTVADPQVSPEGDWIAYAVSSVDSAKDKSASDIWMTNWAGTQHIRSQDTKTNRH